MATLILLRHGQSEWNHTNQFTGWHDSDLTELGRREARRGGALLREAELLPTVVHTSVLRRAIQTAEITLDELGRTWIPVRRSWRLNERHYGDLTGLDKAATAERFGAEQVHVWRRSYDVPPPPISADNRWNPNDDERYAGLPPELIPDSECLKDVVERMLPYWYDAIVPDLQSGHVVLVAAHGNSLRALVKHLDGIGDDEIADLNLPTGMPLLYQLDVRMRPVHRKDPLERALDPEAAKAGAEAVRTQASA